MILQNFLNRRYSTRNLTDVEFESLIEQIATELENHSFITTYSEIELKQDWKNLVQWSSTENYINSTSRIGMKLCEHFFPNFYDIENNKGDSFRNLWKKDNLIKILRWNRKSHSTPYLSEIKRGVYFCLGLPKSTMYRPQIAKLICNRFRPYAVLDPCAGWGGRMLGVTSSGAKYIAFEPNTITYNNLKSLAKFCGIDHQVKLYCDDALNMPKYDFEKVDMIITSPPYFDLEIYSKESSQSITNYQKYETWSENFLKQLVTLCVERLNKNGVSCWNVGKVGKHDMSDDVLTYHKLLNYSKIDTYSVVSSKRQTNQKKNSSNNKNSDVTIVYRNSADKNISLKCL
ncbi:hypothetical protein EBS02_01920 [bacterium]|nr:hypothetical protein [bacterium]